MNRLWVMGGMAAALAAGNVGCYLDQLQAEQRANRVLQEKNARTAEDLADSESLKRQKDTQIDSMGKELASKEQQVASLNVENGKLRDSLGNAEAILKEMAGKPGGSVQIIRTALPEKVSNALRELATKYPGMLEFDEKTGAVRWKADLLFPLGSDKMTDNPELLAAMKEFAMIVNSPEAGGLDVCVVGHTCNTPIKRAETRQEHKSNWHLSTHRAISVMSLLVDDGVNMDRMGAMGYGEYRPIADNTNQAGKSKNRRVEIYLVQKGAVQSYQNNPSMLTNTGHGSSTEVGSPAAMPTRKPVKSTHRTAPMPQESGE